MVQSRWGTTCSLDTISRWRATCSLMTRTVAAAPRVTSRAFDKPSSPPPPRPPDRRVQRIMSRVSCPEDRVQRIVPRGSCPEDRVQRMKRSVSENERRRRLFSCEGDVVQLRRRQSGWVSRGGEVVSRELKYDHPNCFSSWSETPSFQQ